MEIGQERVYGTAAKGVYVLLSAPFPEGGRPEGRGDKQTLGALAL